MTHVCQHNATERAGAASAATTFEEHEMTIPENRAVIDRIEDGEVAVLLVGPGELPRHVPVDELPPDAEEGSWVVLDTVTAIVLNVDREMTAARREQAEGRLDRIRDTRSGGRFRRDDAPETDR